MQHYRVSRSRGCYDGKRRVLSTHRLAITRHCVPESYLFPPESAPTRRNIRSVLKRLQYGTLGRLCLSRVCVTNRKSGLTFSLVPRVRQPRRTFWHMSLTPESANFPTICQSPFDKEVKNGKKEKREEREDSLRVFSRMELAKMVFKHITPITE